MESMLKINSEVFEESSTRLNQISESEARTIPYDCERDEIRFQPFKADQYVPWKILYFDLPVRIIGQERIEKHWHRAVEILLPLEGGMIVRVDGHKHIVHENEILLVNSGAVHEMRAVDPNVCYKGYSIQISSSYLESRIPHFETSVFDVTFHNSPLLVQMLLRMAELGTGRDPYRNLRVQLLLDQILMELVEKHMHVKVKTEVSPNMYEQLNTLIAYLEMHAFEPFDASKVCMAMHLSYPHLARILKDETGMSMHEYVNALRLEKAKELLSATDSTIQEISEKLGYPNAKSFNNAFRKMISMRPSEFRMKVRNNNI